MVDLRCGDCLEVMTTLASSSVDLIFCDLPYGITGNVWDTKINFELLWKQYKRIIKKNGVILLFSSQPFTSELVMSNKSWFKYEYIWFKNVPTGMANAGYAPMKYHESILVFCEGKVKTFNKQKEYREGIGKGCYKYEHYCGESNHVKMKKVKKFYDAKLVNPSSIQLFKVVPNRKDKLHPTQKPVNLLEYFVRTFTNEDELVLDNCMGSGSTGIACLNLKRNFIGIEKEKEYFNIAKERIL
jgi:site-specific DNA-methyltransferase (adenine-specific)